MPDKKVKLLGLMVLVLFMVFIYEIYSLFTGDYGVMLILAPMFTLLVIILLAVMFASREWFWIGLQLFLDKTKRLEARSYNSSFVEFTVAQTKSKAVFGVSEVGLDEVITDKTYHRTTSGNQFCLMREGFNEALNLTTMFVPTIDAEKIGEERVKAYNIGLRHGVGGKDEVLKFAKLATYAGFATVVGIVVLLLADYLLIDGLQKTLLEAINSVKSVTETMVVAEQI